MEIKKQEQRAKNEVRGVGRMAMGEWERDKVVG